MQIRENTLRNKNIIISSDNQLNMSSIKIIVAIKII